MENTHNMKILILTLILLIISGCGYSKSHKKSNSHKETKERKCNVCESSTSATVENCCFVIENHKNCLKCVGYSQIHAKNILFECEKKINLTNSNDKKCIKLKYEESKK